MRMVRFLSREGRDVAWWEKYDALVAAHCSVPWEAVFGYDEPPEAHAGEIIIQFKVQGSMFNVSNPTPRPKERIVKSEPSTGSAVRSMAACVSTSTIHEHESRKL